MFSLFGEFFIELFKVEIENHMPVSEEGSRH